MEQIQKEKEEKLQQLNLEALDLLSEHEEKIAIPNVSKVKRALKTTKSEFNLNVVKMDVVLSM